jgi:tRNA (adenine57-N1/adenine58-N1)-methyltransferase catalytic subunit
LAWNLHGTHAQEGDLAELIGKSHKHFMIQLKEGGDLQTHKGVIKHDDLIGLPWGTEIYSHTGNSFFLVQPALGDLLRGLPRNTQILYPKDIGFILINMGIGPGQHVLEAGTGSGSLTCALAFAVGSTGHVTTYEAKPEMQKRAQLNLERLGLSDRVTFKLRDISEGFDESGVDSLFLDLPNPYDYIAQVRSALKMGGFFGSILPTTNQIIHLLNALRQYDFAFIEVLEIMLRFYKPEPDRLRPTDRMIAHTGFLIFGRPVLFGKKEEEIEEYFEEDGISEDNTLSVG